MPRGGVTSILPVHACGAGGVSKPMEGGRDGGVLLRGYRPYISFMWSIRSMGQSWDTVSDAGMHVHAGLPSLCVHGHWVRFHCSMSPVLIWKLTPHSVLC